ncbi:MULTISPECIES: inorganic phosphate transporter [Desulfococcus]|uniref:Phosphate transporter n=1 Tax=Desulfococcus multivorans DSM 2059 TaxID=1121405 RepID=S7VBH4_DESML|nr:inorganic phosphate transporter [Desulfococcus multivorans]AOY57089.1 phosphate transporter [Desulfococcus multivorans]EPR41798.1 phosphate transporter [Desulfococcus multivorans DSM 2059]SJZ87802.1 inorganic phosphate transporter, PiT family [Desulfococcus multivorans DSM 2059]
MAAEYFVLIIGYVFGFYMSWNIGANDVANSMASAVGAKAITIRQAIFIAGILNIVGAVFIGSHVTDTIRKGIVSTDILTDPHMALIGALAALLASSLWVSFATWKSLPVSTTHSIVGAMVGFGIMAGGFSVVNWGKLGSVVLSWVVSPIFSLIIAYVMFKIIVRLILVRKAAFIHGMRLSPIFIGLAGFVVVLSFLFKTPLGNTLALSDATAVLTAAFLAAVMGFSGKWLLGRILRNEADGDVEEIFRRIQIGTSCYVALAQGANDVANAIGPLAVIYFLVKTGGVAPTIPVPVFLLMFGGVGIACGIGMAGHRVMDTLGNKITTLTNTRGFSVDFAAATTVLAASKLGLPVSTTHAAVGGVLGVGLAHGFEAVNFTIVFQIMLYWVLTVPAAALTSMVIFKILEFII